MMPATISATDSPLARSSEFTAGALAERALLRRAVEAAIWGMPVVSVDAMRQAFFRDAGASYGDILYWSQPADWRFQFTTPNASTRYVYFNFNTRDGPVVLELPRAIGAGLFGSIVGGWQVPLADVGPEGADRGEGGKYLLLPPGYDAKLPEGYLAVRSETYNGYALFRAIPASSSAADVAKALDLVKAMRVYPLARAANPPQQRHLDMAGQLLDGVVHFDAGFFDSLARMVEEEPVLERDLVAMGQLRSLGIGKGLKFAPDQSTREALARAAEEAHAGFVERAMTGERWWPNAQWILSVDVGPKTGFTFLTDDRLEIDERGMLFFLAFAAPKRLGAASFYLGGFRDATGEPLRGDESYRLRVPPDVPAKQYWAATVYDLDTACFIREAPRVSVDSYQDLLRNPDGSVDVYFGPSAPKGREANWIYTAPDRPWFTFFRFYGPDTPLLEKTWTLGDIERLR